MCSTTSHGRQTSDWGLRYFRPSLAGRGVQACGAHAWQVGGPVGRRIEAARSVRLKLLDELPVPPILLTDRLQESHEFLRRMNQRGGSLVFAKMRDQLMLPFDPLIRRHDVIFGPLQSVHSALNAAA